MNPSLKHIITIALVLFAGTYACERMGVPLPAYGVHGIDVSHYQSHIDWEDVAGEGVDFAFVKATEGITLFDTLFCNNWTESRAAGVKRGAYHFFRPTYSAHQQADHFIERVEMEEGDLPPVLDVEVLDGASRVELLKGMYIWLFRVEIAYGIKPIIYTNQKFYNRHLAGHFEDYPLWIARYNIFPPNLANQSEWDFWQYGDRARLNGIHGYVDVNVFHGDTAELEALTLQPKRILSLMD